MNLSSLRLEKKNFAALMIMYFYTQVNYWINEKIELLKNAFLVEKWLVYSSFRRYVVGKPNSIYLPIKILPTFKNNAIMRGSDIEVLLDGVWVLTNSNVFICMTFKFIG